MREDWQVEVTVSDIQGELPLGWTFTRNADRDTYLLCGPSGRLIHMFTSLQMHRMVDPRDAVRRTIERHGPSELHRLHAGLAKYLGAR